MPDSVFQDRFLRVSQSQLYSGLEISSTSVLYVSIGRIPSAYLVALKVITCTFLLQSDLMTSKDSIGMILITYEQDHMPPDRCT